MNELISRLNFRHKETKMTNQFNSKKSDPKYHEKESQRTFYYYLHSIIFSIICQVFNTYFLQKSLQNKDKIKEDHI
jgi:hypothetical protein